MRERVDCLQLLASTSKVACVLRLSDSCKARSQASMKRTHDEKPDERLGDEWKGV